MSDALRAEFERIYGKNKQTKEGEGLDMHRLPHGGYRSMVTHYAWDAFQRGRAQPAPGELLQTIDRKAEAGLCQMTHVGAREFLKDIRKLAAEALAAQPTEGSNGNA